MNDVLVLVVDDNPDALKVMGHILESQGYETAFAMNARQTFDLLDSARPDLILLDIMMPEIDGYEVCRRIQAMPEIKDTPIIFLSALNDPDSVARAYESGGSDFVSKPFHTLELITRIRHHLELKHARDLYEASALELSRAYDVISLKNIELQEAISRMQMLAMTDDMTHLYNRRHTMMKLEEELERYSRNGRVFSVLIGDLDKFKEINDTYGHQRGDHVLCVVADLIRENARAQDTVSRWGGEEFLLLLPETEPAGAGTLAERIREAIETQEIVHDGCVIRTTMTIGIATWRADDTLDSLIRRADESLYEGKRRGRNCVMSDI